MIGELARKVRRQAKRMFCPHHLTLEFETVARIHRGLAREAGSIRAHHAGPDGNTVIPFFCESRTRSDGFETSGTISSCSGKLRLATNAGICGVIDGWSSARHGCRLGHTAIRWSGQVGSNRPLARYPRGREALILAVAAHARSDVDPQNTSPSWRGSAARRKPAPTRHRAGAA